MDEEGVGTGGDAGELSHVDPVSGGSRMVDVGGKEVTERVALACGEVRMSEGVLGRVMAGDGPKGPVLEVARVAGILAAKRTPELIPMCHGLALDFVRVEFEAREAEGVLVVRCEVGCRGVTGVEMEALAGVSVACLTVYDMVKAVDRGMVIGEVRLLEKRGGRSGVWRANEVSG